MRRSWDLTAMRRSKAASTWRFSVRYWAGQVRTAAVWGSCGGGVAKARTSSRSTCAAVTDRGGGGHRVGPLADPAVKKGLSRISGLSCVGDLAATEDEA